MKTISNDKIKIILLDCDNEYGTAIAEFFSGYFEQEKNLSFSHFDSLGLLKEKMILEIEWRKSELVIIYEQKISEREIRIMLDEILVASSAVILTEMGKNTGEKMNKYGKPSDLLRDIIQLIDSKYEKNEFLNEELSEIKTTSRQLVYAGTGFSGGVGTSSFLIGLYNNLNMKGFRVLYIDLSFWSNTIAISNVDLYPDLSFFALMKDKSDGGLRSVMQSVLSKSPRGDSLIIKASPEPDSITEVSGNNIKELIEELINLDMFDFVLLDMNRIHIVELLKDNFSTKGMFFVRRGFEDCEKNCEKIYTQCKDSISKLLSCNVREIVMSDYLKKSETLDTRNQNKQTFLKSKKLESEDNQKIINMTTEEMTKEWSEYAGNMREN